MLHNLFSHPFNWQLAIVYLVVFLLMRIPYVGIHIKTINTFFHEIGHAFAALISNGEIHHIKLNINNSGEAMTATKGWFAKFFVAISGYLFPLFLSISLFVLIHYQHPIWAFYVLAILGITATIMWIRNTYGFIWCAVYVALCVLLYYYKRLYLIKFFLTFNIAALLSENVVASFVLVRLALKNPKQAGDAYSLKQYTFIPTILWALFFLTFSLIVLAISLFYDTTFKIF